MTCSQNFRDIWYVLIDWVKYCPSVHVRASAWPIDSFRPCRVSLAKNDENIFCPGTCSGLHLGTIRYFYEYVSLRKMSIYTCLELWPRLPTILELRATGEYCRASGVRTIRRDCQAEVNCAGDEGLSYHIEICIEFGMDHAVPTYEHVHRMADLHIIGYLISHHKS